MSDGGANLLLGIVSSFPPRLAAVPRPARCRAHVLCGRMLLSRCASPRRGRMLGTGVWRRPRKGDEMGVFEHFREHPGDRPYRRCPACGGELRMFRYSRRPGDCVLLPGVRLERFGHRRGRGEGRSLRRAPALPRRGRARDARWSLRPRGEHGRPLGSPSSSSRSFRNRLCLVSCRPPGAGAEGARDPARRKGGSEGEAAGFPAGRRRRPVVSGELRRHRSERGRPSPKEAGKASRPLRGKRDP